VETIVEILRHHASARPTAVAYRYLATGDEETDSLTFAALFDSATRIATHLLRREDPGNRVLLCLDSGLPFVQSLFGCLCAGIVPVPVDLPRENRPCDRVAGIVRDCRPSAVITSERERSRVARLRADIPECASLYEYFLEDVPTADVNAEFLPTPALDDTACIQYTSGSTSRPQGVVVTHRNLVVNQEQIRVAFGHDHRTKVVGWLPLFHDMGLMGNVLQPAYLGIESTLMPPTRFIQRPLRWLRAISTYRATTSGGPNFAFEHCIHSVADEQVVSLDLSSWRVAFNGAEPVRASTMRAFVAKFCNAGFSPTAFLPCYGLAEATLFVSGCAHDALPRSVRLSRRALEHHCAIPAADLDDDAVELVSNGTCGTDQRIVIVDPERRAPVAPLEVGEIWVRGDNVAREYFGNATGSLRTFHATLPHDSAAYLRTGDLGFLDNGELFIAGRLKDVIIVNGRNIYPQDIEQLMDGKHVSFLPNRCAAFGIEVDGTEQMVIVQEVRRIPKNGDELTGAVEHVVAEVIRHCEVQPYEVCLVRAGTIPMTSSGKVRRHAARAAYLNGIDGIVTKRNSQSRCIPSS
jgi:acyl-CoA synthetase (AMP-forming)/AMP-acid ligase II